MPKLLLRTWSDTWNHTFASNQNHISSSRPLNHDLENDVAGMFCSSGSTGPSKCTYSMTIVITKDLSRAWSSPFHKNHLISRYFQLPSIDLVQCSRYQSINFILIHFHCMFISSMSKNRCSPFIWSPLVHKTSHLWCRKYCPFLWFDLLDGWNQADHPLYSQWCHTHHNSQALYSWTSVKANRKVQSQYFVSSSIQSDCMSQNWCHPKDRPFKYASNVSLWMQKAK